MPLVNENIRILRKKLGLTQEKFAQTLGIKRSLIGAYEESRAIPPADNLTKISNIFNISLEQLLNHSYEREFRKNEAQNEAIQKETSLNKYILETEKNKFISEVSNSFSSQKPVIQQFDLFSNPPENNNIANGVNIENGVIRYLNNNALTDYIANISNNSFFNNLPTLVLPFLPKGYLRAFDAPAEFPLKDCILIAERVENFDLLKEGENHLIISKTKGFIYRRVYNQTKIKGVFLTNSDKAGVNSCELPENDVLEIWMAKSYFSKTMPMPQMSLAGIQNKINALADDINYIVGRVEG
jgi:transcriptional regulator with XRE-family HTH domain